MHWATLFWRAWLSKQVTTIQSISSYWQGCSVNGRQWRSFSEPALPAAASAVLLSDTGGADRGWQMSTPLRMFCKGPRGSAVLKAECARVWESVWLRESFCPLVKRSRFTRIQLVEILISPSCCGVQVQGTRAVKPWSILFSLQLAEEGLTFIKLNLMT